MIVELVSHSTNAEKTISRGGALCYGKDNGDPDRIGRLKTSGHLAVLRHGFATFIVRDISVPAHVQFVRSPFLYFLVESKRYVKASQEDFVYPNGIGENDNNYASSIMFEAVCNAYESYEKLLDAGVAKEDARAILPSNAGTNMMVSGTFQAWLGFLKLRVDTHAQAEIRQIAIYIWSTLAVNFPLVFKDLIFQNKGLQEWENYVQNANK